MIPNSSDKFVLIMVFTSYKPFKLTFLGFQITNFCGSQ